VIDRQLDFYNDHDMDGFLSTYSEAVELFNQGEALPFMVGHGAMRERYSKRFSNPALKANIASRMVMGNFVIDHEHIEGIIENDIVKAIVIYEVLDGLIRRAWFIRE